MSEQHDKPSSSSPTALPVGYILLAAAFAAFLFANWQERHRQDRVIDRLQSSLEELEKRQVYGGFIPAQKLPPLIVPVKPIAIPEKEPELQFTLPQLDRK